MRTYRIKVYATLFNDLPVLLEEQEQATVDELLLILASARRLEDAIPSIIIDIMIDTLDAEVEVTREERDENLSKIFDKFFSKGGKLS